MQLPGVSSLFFLGCRRPFLRPIAHGPRLQHADPEVETATPGHHSWDPPLPPLPPPPSPPVETAVARYGRLDGAFNNVGGVVAPGRPADVDVAGWMAELELNLNSVFYCLRAQLPALLAAGGGAVVNKCFDRWDERDRRSDGIRRGKARRRRFDTGPPARPRWRRHPRQRSGHGQCRHSAVPRAARRRAGRRPRLALRAQPHRAGCRPGGGRCVRGLPAQRRRAFRDGRDPCGGRRGRPPAEHSAQLGKRQPSTKRRDSLRLSMQARSPECQRQPAVETVSDGTRTRDRLDHNTARACSGVQPRARLDDGPGPASPWVRITARADARRPYFLGRGRRRILVRMTRAQARSRWIALVVLCVGRSGAVCRSAS